MDPKVQCTAEALDQHDCAGAVVLCVKPAFFEFLLDIPRQFPTLLCYMGDKFRVILCDDPIEKGLLWPVTLVTTSIPVPGDRPGCPERDMIRILA